VPRGTVDVDKAVDAVAAANPQAVLFIGQSKPAAALIKGIRAKGQRPQFMVLSVASGLHADLGEEAAGIIVSQVVPYPFTELGTPVVREYQKIVGALDDKKFSYNSMEGFINAKLVVAALQKIQPPYTRAKVIATLEGMTNEDLGGFAVSYSKQSNLGSRFVFTLTSVACALSSTAANSSNTLVYSSSVTGIGLAAFRVAKNGAMSSFFMPRSVSAACGRRLSRGHARHVPGRARRFAGPPELLLHRLPDGRAIVSPGNAGRHINQASLPRQALHALLRVGVGCDAQQGGRDRQAFAGGHHAGHQGVVEFGDAAKQHHKMRPVGQEGAAQAVGQAVARHRDHAAGVVAFHEIHRFAAAVHVPFTREAPPGHGVAVAARQPFDHAESLVAAGRANAEPVKGLGVGQALRLGKLHGRGEAAQNGGGRVLGALFKLLAQCHHAAAEMHGRFGGLRHHHGPRRGQQARAPAAVHGVW
jgi:hypothetical protein